MRMLVDLICLNCKHEMIDEFIDSNKKLPECPKCQTIMNKLPSALRFELKYDNRKDMCDWQGNTSQYWNDIKTKGGEEPPNDKQEKWV